MKQLKKAWVTLTAHMAIVLMVGTVLVPLMEARAATDTDKVYYFETVPTIQTNFKEMGNGRVAFIVESAYRKYLIMNNDSPDSAYSGIPGQADALSVWRYPTPQREFFFLKKHLFGQATPKPVVWSEVVDFTMERNIAPQQIPDNFNPYVQQDGATNSPYDGWAKYDPAVHGQVIPPELNKKSGKWPWSRQNEVDLFQHGVWQFTKVNIFIPGTSHIKRNIMAIWIFATNIKTGERVLWAPGKLDTKFYTYRQLGKAAVWMTLIISTAAILWWIVDAGPNIMSDTMLATNILGRHPGIIERRNDMVVMVT